MALKNIEVFVDATPEGEKRVDYAATLAGALIGKRAETILAGFPEIEMGKGVSVRRWQIAQQMDVVTSPDGIVLYRVMYRSHREQHRSRCADPWRAVRPRGRYEARVFR